MVSKSTTLPFIYDELKRLNAVSFKTIDLAQGQKKSRIVAWTFKVI
jgi:23S rRNA (adenine1618-N6)-methyltransferase